MMDAVATYIGRAAKAASVRLFTIAALTVAILTSASPALCGQGYTITLANGNKVAANSYTVKGDRLTLFFPLGEAELKLSDIASIKDDAGNDMPFQEKGEYVQKKPDTASGSGSADYAAVSDEETSTDFLPAYEGDTPSDTTEQTEKKWTPAYYSPQIKEVDSFIDAMFKADDEGREIPEEEVDKAFEAFFNDGTGNTDVSLK